MARTYPAIAPLRELRASLSQMRLSDLAVGRDGRNRTMLSAFRARTGRNQPSNTKFIFGPAVWLRGLIRPPPGHGIAYIDWQQQEFGIAAALSGDPLMMAAYRSGDPYLAFAKQAGAAPEDANKGSHKAVRDQFKSTVLAVQYGMGADTLAQRISQPLIHARGLLRLHRETYRVFWRWSDAAVDHAMLTGSLHTVFGWRVRVSACSNERSLRNFPMQANGAEMLRLACCLATEQGIEVCAPVHDAVLICAPLERLETDMARMRAAMAEASRIVLDGFELGTDAHIVRYPDRYMDERGAVMWDHIIGLIEQQHLKMAA
jgi:DNA polymerase I-like protein with 3'-5' exonuclease and polymerase domains